MAYLRATPRGVSSEYRQESEALDGDRERRSNKYLQAMRAVSLVRKITNGGEVIGEQFEEDPLKEGRISSYVALGRLRMAATSRLSSQVK